MAAALKITLDTTAFVPMLDAVCSAVEAVGVEEAERRIGRPIDEALIGGLFAFHAADGDLSIAPTPEYKRVIAALR
jgi:hypothetical protein